MVLFPKILQTIENQKKRKKLLWKSLILVLLIGIPPVAIYAIYPKLPILILFGNQYLEISSLIGAFGASMLFISLSYILIYYHLAKKNYLTIYSIYFFIFLEILLIYLFHNSIGAVVNTLLAVTSLSFFFLLLTIIFEKKEPNKLKLTNLKSPRIHSAS